MPAEEICVPADLCGKEIKAKGEGTGITVDCEGKQANFGKGNSYKNAKELIKEEKEAAAAAAAASHA